MRCCRSCRSPVRFVADFGAIPLVNRLLLSADARCDVFPLRLVRCLTCGLMQLADDVPPEAMFGSYTYFSGQSSTMVAHAGRLVDRFVGAGDRVLEIASNDGYLLGQAREKAGAVLGVEPAANVAEVARAVGVPTEVAYFNEATATRLRETVGVFDVIFANNVLAHTPDPNEIAAGIRILLGPGAVAHVEVPDLLTLLDSDAFETVYHEHYSYFSLAAMKQLFNRHGLMVVGVTRIGIHGGSLHVQIAHDGDESEVEAAVARERRNGLLSDEPYERLTDSVDRLRKALRPVLGEFSSMAAYGAAAKGIVLLNLLGLDCRDVSFVADVSDHKQGRWIPGTRQQIEAPSALLERRPEGCLLLPWNLREEILTDQRAYLDSGGRFVIPRPRVEVIGGRHAREFAAGVEGGVSRTA